MVGGAGVRVVVGGGEGCGGRGLWWGLWYEGVRVVVGGGGGGGCGMRG